MGPRLLSRDEMADLALNIVQRVKEAGDNVSKGFRSRARGLFTDAYYLGCLQMIAFTYAKATFSGVEAAMKFLSGEDEAMKDLKDEQASYALYGAAILYYLQQVGILTRQEELNNILKAVERYEFLILPFLSWLKLIAEAEIQPEERP